MADTLSAAPRTDLGRDIDWAAHIGVLVRGWRTVLFALLGALALGAAVTLLTPASYTAQTTLEIDRETPKVTPIGETAPVVSLLSADEFYQTQYGLLRGRALAARVAATLALDRDGRFIARMRQGEIPLFGLGEGGERAQEVVEILRRHLHVAPLRGSRLVTIAFNSPDRVLSARIAAAFADAFIDSGLDRRFAASSYARDFLGRRLAQARTSLETGERNLADYAAAQGVLALPGPVAGRSLTAASLEALNTALDGAKAERVLAEQRWRQGEAAGAAAPEVLASPTVQLLSQDRARLAADYQDQLNVYKPDYPDMRRLKARMDETDTEMARAAGEILKSLQSRYVAAEGAEAALTGQVARLRTALVDLRARSVGYDVRSREVDADRAVYDGLLQRYQDVGIAGGVLAGNVYIVDAATPPDHPSWPRPWLIMLLAALAGLVGGVATVLVLQGRGQVD